MEFHDLGKHCAADSCGQQDFLPFKCDACAGVYCLEHRTRAGHACANANAHDKRVLECSKCNRVLRRPPGINHDVLMDRHVASGCTEGIRKARPNKIGCTALGCRGSEFVKVSCKTCRQNFCFRHRHEDDHKCTGMAITTQANRGAGRASSILRYSVSSQRSPLETGHGAKPGCGAETGQGAERRAREHRSSSVTVR